MSSAVPINLMFVVIVVGFIAYIIEKRIRIKKMIGFIQQEPEKYTFNSNYNICSNSNGILGNIILLALVLIVIITPILYFMGSPYYGVMSLIMIILFLALINFSPYYINIEDGKISYRHLIDTLNQTITIPITKIERITYWEETSIKKILSLYINELLSIDINILLISNYEEIIKVLDNYMNSKENTNIENNIQYNFDSKKKIKVRTHTDYKLLMIVCMAIEAVTIFSVFIGYHDIVTISAIIAIPLFMFRFLPYKIVFYGDRLEYKHVLHTHNKVEKIFINDINNADIIGDTLGYTRYTKNNGSKTTKVKHYILNIYKKDGDIISLRLFYENMGDVKQIVNIINSNHSIK